MEVDDATEYTQCLESWRFFVGLRFTVFAFFLTLTSALLYVVLTNSKFENNAYRAYASIVGLICTIAVYVIEIRNQHLYDVCCNRARMLEKRSNRIEPYKQESEDTISLAFAVQITTRTRSLFPRQLLTHSTGFFILYLIATIVWIVILWSSVTSDQSVTTIIVTGSSGPTNLRVY